MTPHHLHALAAAWSLQAARQTLAFHVDRERRHNGRNLLDAADILRAPIYGQRLSGGGHGDPVSGLLTAGRRPPRETLWFDRWNTADSRLNGIYRMFAIPEPRNLQRLLTAMPGMSVGVVRILTKHLDDEDALLRGPEWLDQPRPTTPLVGVPCPHCGERQLHVQTAGPIDTWTVICATGRLCTGAGCGCGMPGAVEGVAHIWPRAAVLGAVAGAAPTQ
ncbi:hypothetical protein [Micromonospora aurantiaca (nom. illeg.)]|uniref:hypothetical protein n=1 Tax=Micromonospora aurantiaca (nom. illeg.) TaxID=47850 RepID=UPI0033C401F8